MIVSKGSLKVVDLTTPDKNIPVLNNVLIERDGTVVACNGRAVLAVSPPAEEIKQRVPIEESTLSDGITISADGIRSVIKAIPRDALFGGLLEYCDIADEGDRARFTISDGKRKHGIEGKKYSRKFVDYKAMLQEASSHKKVATVVINRKRLLQLLKTLTDIVPDPNGEAQVMMEFTDQHEVIFRSINPVNKQRVLGMMGTYQGPEALWPKRNEWELQFQSSVKTAKVAKT